MRHVRCSIAAMAVVAFAFMSSQDHLVYAQMKPAMTAKLIDAEKNAADRGATVEVTTSSVELTDPAISKGKPVVGQGHLHYQVDKGPVIATPTAKLSFHELTPGAHIIVVELVGNDHKPLGPRQELSVTVPEGRASTSGDAAKPAAPAAGAPGAKPKSGY